MCLAVPGCVVRWLDRDPLTATAEIDFGGLKKSCHMACTPDAKVGDYVLVHAGVALTVMDCEAAARALAAIAALDEIQ
jgi:hydrogenase expression/formation protein HypC